MNDRKLMFIKILLFPTMGSIMFGGEDE